MSMASPAFEQPASSNIAIKFHTGLNEPIRSSRQHITFPKGNIFPIRAICLPFANHNNAIV